MALVTAADLKTYMDISLTNRQMDAVDIVLAGLQSEMEMYLRRPIQGDPLIEYVEEHTVPSTHTGIPASSFFTNSNPSNESFTGNTLDNTTYLEPPATIYLLNTPVVSVSRVVLTPSVSVRTFEITTKSLTSNVATLTASKTHSYAVGDVVKVSNIDSTFNGIVTITVIPSSTQFSYAKTAANVASVALSPKGKVLRKYTRELEETTDYIPQKYGLDVFNTYADDIVTVTYTGGLVGEDIPGIKLIILRAASREMQNMHDDVVGLKDLETRNVAPLQTGFLESELMTLKRYRKNRIG
jgi:hypothetical protein